MLTFFKDFFVYPFTSAKESNRFGQFLQFIAKDYPAYFRAKPTLRRILVMPFLAMRVMIRGSVEEIKR